MNSQIDHNDFLDSYIVKESGNDEFRIGVDLDTRIAGVIEFIISRNKFVVNCLDYPITIKNYGDFDNILQLTEYKLLEEEYNPYKIRKILRYLDKLEKIITSIISYFRRAL